MIRGLRNKKPLNTFSLYSNHKTKNNFIIILSFNFCFGHEYKTPSPLRVNTTFLPSVDGKFYEYSTSPMQAKLSTLWTRYIFCNIFYFFIHSLSLYILFGDIEGVWSWGIYFIWGQSLLWILVKPKGLWSSLCAGHKQN